MSMSALARKLPSSAGNGEFKVRSAPLVAIVDDTDANRYSLMRIIKSAGYEVVTGSCGRHALELVSQQKPDLLVVDVKMPDITGWEVCAQIKREPTTATVPILQVSASYTTDEDLIHGLDNGADGYLVHPVDPHVLLATVRALLRMKAAHEAAERSENYLRSILQSAPVILFAVDGQGLYTLFTGSAQGRLPLGASAVVGQSLFEVHSHDEQFTANAARALKGESFVDDVCWHGRWFEIRYNAVATSQGQRGGFTAVATDITDRKKAQQAREDLLAVVAHDLRAPISGVLLGVQLLKRLLTAPSPRLSADAALATIDRSARSAERLIADLLDHAKIQAGTFMVEPRAQDLVPLLREAVDLMLPIARDKSIDLVLQPVNGPIPAPFDATPLLQAICNVIGNAIKFSPEASRVTFEVATGGDEIVVAIRDQGPGVPEADLPFLFDRFWQGARDRKQGAGLGLSITAGIVSAHGGRVWVENNATGGATFYIALPKCRPVAAG